MVTTVLTQLFNELGNYKTAPLMAPFIYLLALAALGKHRRGFTQPPSDVRPKQQLTMILVTNYGIKYFFSCFGMTNPYGFYDTKNAVFISFNDEELNKLKENKPKTLLEIILHELAHFAAAEIMDNDSNPYPKQNDKVKKDYLKIVSQVKEAALQWKFSDKVDSKSENDAYLEALVIEGFQSVFNDYKESEHASELFVTIAQTIAILGYEKGCQWLKTHVPDLVKFYEEQFNPACIDYLKQHQVWEHIDLDPEFAKILGVNNEHHHEQPFYGNVLHPGLKEGNLNNSADNQPSKIFSHF